MRRTFKYILGAVLVLFPIACEEVIEDNPLVNNTPMEIPQRIAALTPAMDAQTRSSDQGAGLIMCAPESWDEVDTRTYAVIDQNSLDATGEYREYYQYWSEGDAISLFVTTANLKYVMNSYKDGTLDIGEFHLAGPEEQGDEIETPYYYSVYPYKESTFMDYDGLITYEFPKEQHYSGDTYANGENGMIAIEPKEGTDSVLYFQNFCSYLQLRLVANASSKSTTVKKIILTANNSKDLLAGEGVIEVADEESVPNVKMSTEPYVDMNRSASNQITLDCGAGVALGTDKSNPTKFWFVLPAASTFSGGFNVSVVFDDNTYYKKSTQKKIGIERSHIKPMATFETEGVQGQGPIRYKYNDTTIGEPFPLTNTFYDQNGVKLSIINQIYDEENEEWVVILDGTLGVIGDNSFKAKGPDIEYIKVDNDENPVTINSFAFYNCSADSLMVYNPVTSIGKEAFASSTIKDINIYSDVASINTSVASGSKIENIHIIGSVESIDDGAFKDCKTIKKVDIDDNIGTIGQLAFDECDNLEIFYVGGDVDKIGKQAFKNLDKLHNLNIEGDVNVIGQDAFDDCDAMEKIHIHGDIDKIESKAFYQCDILETVEIIGHIESIGEQAFSGCKDLNSLDIQAGVDVIAKEAFSDCDALTNVQIKGDILSIGENAFHDCDELLAVNIEGNIGSIGLDAFDGCDLLEDVNVKGDIKTIGQGAFSSCPELDKVIIEGNVTTIEKGAFNGCPNLTTFSVESVETIQYRAFYQCENLVDLNIPGVKYVEQGAFRECKSLQTINLDSIVTIDDNAFYDCYSLTRVEIGPNCTKIGEGAFCNTMNLKDVYCYAVEPPFIETDNESADKSYVFIVNDNVPKDLIIYVPKGSGTKYKRRNYFSPETNWWYEEYRAKIVEMQ